jgi:hypothetical protein
LIFFNNSSNLAPQSSPNVMVGENSTTNISSSNEKSQPVAATASSGKEKSNPSALNSNLYLSLYFALSVIL